MNKKWRQALIMVGALAVGGLVGMAAAKLLYEPGAATRPPTPLAYKLALLPLVLISFFLVVAIHELGHVLAGQLVGFRFRALTVGPFMWEKEEGRIRFKWNRNLNAAGGLALCLPMGAHRLERRFIIFAAGGPLASLLLALAGFAGLRMAVPVGPSFASYALEFLWLMLFTLSAVICLATLVPMRAGGFLSDGGRILQLLKGGPKAFIDVVCLQAIAQSYSGVRPRQLNPGPLLEALAKPVASPFKTYLHGFLYLHYLDLGDTGQAATALDQYAAGIADLPKGYHAVIYLEQVWFEAWHRGDATKARQYRQLAVPGAFIPQAQFYRADAALAFAEGQYQLAAEKARAALGELERSMDRGAAVAEKEWLEHLLHTVLHPTASPVASAAQPGGI